MMLNRSSPAGKGAFAAVYKRMAEVIPTSLLDAIVAPLVGLDDDARESGIRRHVDDFRVTLLPDGELAADGASLVFAMLLRDHLATLERNGKWRH
jgi:hypothetical protein